MITGVDYSKAKPSVTELVARGMVFACRYVGIGSVAKRLTPEEAQDLSRHGLSVVCLAEADERGALAGKSRGTSHAVAARNDAARCGAPASAPIYFAVDFDTALPQRIQVRDYFRGVAEVIGWDRVGAYGEFEVIKDLFDEGLIRWACQTYAWSHGRWDPRAQLRQTHNAVPLGGGMVDLCHATTPNYGGWRIGDHAQDVKETVMDDELRRAIHHIGWRQYGHLAGTDPIRVPAAPELGIEAYEMPNIPLRELRALAAGLPAAILTELDRHQLAAAAHGVPAGLVLPDTHLPDEMRSGDVLGAPDGA